MKYFGIRLRAAAVALTGVALGAPALATAQAQPATPTGGASTASATLVSPEWPMAGQNIANSRSNPFANAITPANAGRLTTAWTAIVHGDVSATPAVVDGAVYVPDWGGYLSKLDARTGKVIWSFPVSTYDGITGAISRTTPAVVGHTLFIGDQNAPAGGAGAHLLAIDTATGALVWNTAIDNNFAAVLTQSPIVFDGVVYEGVASREETAATLPGYPCCTFRGSLVAVSVATGAILWKTYTLPDNGGKPGGYSGAPIWGGTVAIDPLHHLIYATTGNNYSVPADVQACQVAGGTPGDCLSADDQMDSVLAFDLRTGKLRWATGSKAFDTWTASCLPGRPPNNCPPDPGDDADFADGPHLLLTHGSGGRIREIVAAGQKSGQYWALDALSGAVVWQSSVGPGGLHGGIQWGSATDGVRIYAAEDNIAKLAYTLPDGRTITSGSFLALDPSTGRILWQVPDPTNGEDQGAVTAAGGVVYAGSMTGHMYALDARTGKVLWDQLGQGASNAGPAVVGSRVYWGNGYARFNEGAPSTTFYSFGLAGR